MSTESSTKKVIMVMMVSVPERPSTPSEQFVTLIDTQTKMTVSIPNTTGGIFTEPPNMAKAIVLELKCRYTTATTMATAKSSAPFKYSPHGFSAASSK